MRPNIYKSYENVDKMILAESSRVVEAGQINNGDGWQKP